jgi:hypothetical protein
MATKLVNEFLISKRCVGPRLHGRLFFCALAKKQSSPGAASRTMKQFKTVKVAL